MCTCEVIHELKTEKQTSASRCGGRIRGLDAASRAGFARLVTRDTGNVLDLFVLSLVAVRRPTSRRRVRDHVNNACLRDILMRSGSHHLVDTCTWLIVAHRHARTSSHPAERLNLCLSGKSCACCHPCFTCPCFRSLVHGSGAELRTTALVCCSGIVSRWLRRRTTGAVGTVTAAGWECTASSELHDRDSGINGRCDNTYCDNSICLDGRHACALETL